MTKLINLRSNASTKKVIEVYKKKGFYGVYGGVIQYL